MSHFWARRKLLAEESSGRFRLVNRLICFAESFINGDPKLLQIFSINSVSLCTFLILSDFVIISSAIISYFFSFFEADYSWGELVHVTMGLSALFRPIRMDEVPGLLRIFGDFYIEIVAFFLKFWHRRIDDCLRFCSWLVSLICFRMALAISVTFSRFSLCPA